MADFSDLTFLAYDHVLLPPPDDVTAYLDAVPPVVTLLSPAALATILEDTAISLRIVDDRRLTRAFLWVEYADGSSEVIFRDGDFLPPFKTYSTWNTVDLRTLEFVVARGVIDNGVRVGGWPSSPSIYAGGIDQGGNVA